MVDYHHRWKCFDLLPQRVLLETEFEIDLRKPEVNDSNRTNTLGTYRLCHSSLPDTDDQESTTSPRQKSWSVRLILDGWLVSAKDVGMNMEQLLTRL